MTQELPGAAYATQLLLVRYLGLFRPLTASVQCCCDLICFHGLTLLPVSACPSPSCVRHISTRTSIFTACSSSSCQSHTVLSQPISPSLRTRHSWLEYCFPLQVKYLFGYSQYVIPATATAKAKTVTFPRHDPIHKQLGDLFGHEWTPFFHWREFIMGGAFLVIILSMKEIGRRYPR